MGNRCPECNKFVSLEPMAELDQDPEIDDNGTITTNIRLAMQCADCGTEMSETTFDIEYECPEAAEHMKETEHQCICDHLDTGHNDIGQCLQVPCTKCDTGYTRHSLEVEASGDPEPSDRYESTDATGKSIPHRFQRHFYTATVDITVTCNCGKSWDVTLEADEIQASGMEDLV